jgi:predicted outer membrane repeat protein
MRCLQVACLVLGIALASPCLARTWYISPDGMGDASTIQAGIDSALAGDTVLLADGVYTGDGNRDISYCGKAITVCSVGDDPTFCIIDCDGSEAESHRGFVFECGEGEDAVLRGVTITNGAWYEGDGAGGGILCWGGSPSLINVIIVGNRAARMGGGIACGDSACPVLEHMRIDDNVAEKTAGGGIHWEQGCTPVLNDIVFESNSARSAGGAVCGEFYFDRCLSNCRFIGNTGGYGGAVALCCSDCAFEDCRFSGNSAHELLTNPGGGGALILLAGAATITRCDFEGNSSVKDGSAITVMDSRVTMESCVFDAK